MCTTETVRPSSVLRPIGAAGTATLGGADSCPVSVAASARTLTSLGSFDSSANMASATDEGTNGVPNSTSRSSSTRPRDGGAGSLEGYLTAKALVAALKLAGPEPTRDSFVQGLLKAGTLEVNGLRARYKSGDYTGLSTVDLAIYTREGRFMH